MFEDWKQAWRQAVENFHREAGDGTAGAPPRVRAMERELTSAAGALAKLDEEIARTRRDHAKEREAEQVCRRREALARDVNDDETVRIAAEFAERHAQRAAVLERKIAVLDDERALLSRDVGEMRKTMAEVAPGVEQPRAGNGVGSGDPRRDDDASAHAFSKLEREARERAADQRLEELKKKMRP